jgi:hypothetical protein
MNPTAVPSNRDSVNDVRPQNILPCALAMQFHSCTPALLTSYSILDYMDRASVTNMTPLLLPRPRHALVPFSKSFMKTVLMWCPLIQTQKR